MTNVVRVSIWRKLSAPADAFHFGPSVFLPTLRMSTLVSHRFTQRSLPFVLVHQVLASRCDRSIQLLSSSAVAVPDGGRPRRDSFHSEKEPLFSVAPIPRAEIMAKWP